MAFIEDIEELERSMSEEDMRKAFDHLKSKFDLYTATVEKLIESKKENEYYDKDQTSFLVNSLNEIREKIDLSPIVDLFQSVTSQNKKLLDLLYRMFDMVSKPKEVKDYSKEMVGLVLEMMTRQNQLLSNSLAPRTIEVKQPEIKLPEPIEQKKRTFESTLKKNSDNSITIISKEI